MMKDQKFRNYSYMNLEFFAMTYLRNSVITSVSNFECSIPGYVTILGTFWVLKNPGNLFKYPGIFLIPTIELRKLFLFNFNFKRYLFNLIKIKC